jgi:hypothetical protein
VKKGVTRAYWLVLCFGLFAVSHLAFWIFTHRWTIPIVAIVTGLAYGGTSPRHCGSISIAFLLALTSCA